MQFALAQHSTSKPIPIGAGTNITVAPSTGATALVEYTSDTAAAIANGTATWSAWANGTVSAAAKDKPASATTMRVTANNGPVYIDVSDVPVGSVSPAQIVYDTSNSPSLVDAAGNTIRLGAKGYSNRVGNIAGGQRSPGNSNFVSGASGLKTLNIKVEAEAPFTAVRVWIGHKPTTGAVPTWKAVVAPTETMARDTVANAFTPIVGGTQYNALATTTYGWRAVTWNGNSQVTSSLATPPADNPASVNTCSYSVSDWIPCNSLSRVDVAGGRPAALLKIAQTDAAAPYNQLNGTLATYYTNRGAAAYREWITGQTLDDAVTTLTSLPASVPAAGVAPFYVWLEFQYTVPTRNVAIIGDSTTESLNNQFQWMSWVDQALRELSTQAAPIAVTNLAGSGHTHYQYLALFDNMAAAGFAPTDVFLQGWSQNGFAATNFSADDLIARDSIYLNKFRNAGIQVWMSTSYGGGGYSAPGEVTRVKCVNQVKAWAAAGLVNLVDTDSIITDYSSGVGKLAAVYDPGDHTHSTAPGQRLMADLLKSVWR